MDFGGTANQPPLRKRHSAPLPTVLPEDEIDVSEYNALLPMSQSQPQLQRRHTMPSNMQFPSAEFVYEPEILLKQIADISNRLLQNSSGLTVLQAVVVHFLSALGAGMALVAWYPKICGYLLFPVAMAVVAVTASLGGSAIMDVAVKTGASTFSELCDSLPGWMRLLAEVSTVAWYLCLLSMYVKLTADGLNDQLFSLMGSDAWPHGRAVPGSGELELYTCVGAAVFLVTTPRSLVGPIASFLNALNFLATWTVIIVAVAKGIVTTFSESQKSWLLVLQHSKSLAAVVPSGFVKVIVLLSGSMCCCGSMPQLNSDLRSDCRKRAVWIVPVVVAALQGTVFLAMGMAGYLALGDAIDGDAFKAYAKMHPDWMTTALQVGICVVLFLSTPLLMLPVKSQVWAFITRALSIDGTGGFASAPAAACHGLNAALIAVCVVVPLWLGESNFMALFTVLAGTAANWINLFLPSMVIVYVQVLPAWHARKAWHFHAAVAMWIFGIAVVCAIDAAVQIVLLFE